MDKTVFPTVFGERLFSSLKRGKNWVAEGGLSILSVPQPWVTQPKPRWHATPSLLATASQGTFLPMLTMVSTPQPTPHPSLGWSGDLPDNDYSIRMSRCGALPTVSGDQVLLVGFNFTQVILMAFGLTSLAKGSHPHICRYMGCLVPPLPQMENLSNDCSF